MSLYVFGQKRNAPEPSPHAKRHSHHRNRLGRRRRRGYLHHHETNKISAFVPYENSERRNIRPLVLDARVLVLPPENEKPQNTSDSKSRSTWQDKVDSWNKVKDTFVNKVVRDAPTPRPSDTWSTRVHYCSFQVGKDEYFQLKAPVFDAIKEGSADGKDFDNDDEDDDGDDEFTKMKSTMTSLDGVRSSKSTASFEAQLNPAKSTVPTLTGIYVTRRATNASVAPTFWSRGQPTSHQHRVMGTMATVPSSRHVKVTVASTLSSFMVFISA